MFSLELAAMCAPPYRTGDLSEALWSRTFLFYLMSGCAYRYVCAYKQASLRSPCRTHLQCSAGFLSPVLAVGGCQRSRRVTGAARPGVCPGSPLQQEEAMEVPGQSRNPPRAEGRQGPSVSCVSLSAAGVVNGGRGRSSRVQFLLLKRKMVLIWAFYRLGTIFSLHGFILE